MRWNKYILALAGAACFAGGVFAQTSLISYVLSGNETWSVGLGGPQGPSIFVTSAEMRNAAGTTLLNGGYPATIIASNLFATYIQTSQITAATSMLAPQPAWDGELLEIVNGSGSNNSANIALAPNGTQVVNNPAIATMGTNSSVAWRFSTTSNTWFRLR